jgi:hypothetical protein
VRNTPIQQFREAVYQTFKYRADAFIDILDALTTAGHVNSPVCLSEEALFRRKFSSIYDVLGHAQFDRQAVRQLLYQYVPDTSGTIAGFRIYALDTTVEERPEAKTLADRGCLRRDEDHSVQYGHKYSWLVRLVNWGTSWVAPLSFQRVATDQTPSQVAKEQMIELEAQDPLAKVVVSDSHYGNQFYLATQQLLRNTQLLVRLRHNIALCEAPLPKPPGIKRGPPRKHGPKFKLARPSRSPDLSAEFQLLPHQPIRAEAWLNLHLRPLPQVVGMAVRIFFLRTDGAPRHKYPLWLFWTGPTSVSLADLTRMYLWRFAIEHAFRFLKQHLGLTANYSTLTPNIQNWLWLCLLAYWQLLLMQPEVEDASPAWYPQRISPISQSLTPWKVQRASLSFLLRLGTPALLPKVSGNGWGRPKGYHPPIRARFKTVVKGKKRLVTNELSP